MKATDLLKKQHRQVEKLFKEVEKTEDPKQRRKLMEQIAADLKMHTQIEEEIFYPAVREVGTAKAEEMIDEAFEEHHVVDLLLQELAAACPGGRGWAAKVRVLEEMLRLHVKQEELDLFPLAQAHLDADALALMAREFRALKHERIESLLGPLRRATPAFAGRATVHAQATAGRLVRRGELAMRHVLARLPS
jgi:iron-sulfur cluster repair protein YtfE (RIC family)